MSTATMTDTDLQRDVLDELKWEPSVDPAHIGVAVKDGVVTLTGHVQSYWEKYAAEKAATPLDLVESAARGIDMFDCVLPTRNARNGQLFTSAGRLNIKNAEFADDPRPLDPECGCYTCTRFSRAYLRHLFQAGEMTAGTLNTLHNLHFYLDTMNRIREAIVFAALEELRQKFRRIFPARPADSTVEE